MSRQLDSLLKGLAVFQEGVQQFQTSRAISDAKKELDSAKLTFAANEGMTPEQVGIESEFLDQRKNEISQNLSMRLAQTGASATQIAAATGFGLTRAQEQDANVKLLGEKAKLVKTAVKSQEKAKDFSTKLALEEPEKLLSTGTGKTLVDGITSLDNMINQLETNPSAPVVELAKSSFIKAIEGGKVTDADIERMAVDPSYRGKILRKLGIEIRNAPSMKEVEFFKELGQQIRDKSVTQLRSLSDSRVKAIGSAAPDSDKERISAAFKDRMSPFKTTKEIVTDRALKATEQMVDEQIRQGKLAPENREAYIKALSSQ